MARKQTPFEDITVDFAYRYDLEPSDIEKAYKDKRDLLRKQFEERNDVQTSRKVSMAFGGVAAAGFAVFLVTEPNTDAAGLLMFSFMAAAGFTLAGKYTKTMQKIENSVRINVENVKSKEEQPASPGNQ